MPIMVVILRQDMLLRHGKLEFISAAASRLVSYARTSAKMTA
jgi:hypothetical protein